MTTIAVIGAGSQIAGRVIKRLTQEAGIRTIGISRSPVTAKLIEHEYRCETRVGSLSDPQTCGKLLADCSAIVNLGYSLGTSTTIRSSNRAAIENFGQLAAKGVIERFVHLSSISVYGRLNHPSRNSTFERPYPDTIYGMDKLEQESLVSRYFAKTPANWVILRLGAAYGPGQQTSRDFFAFVSQESFRTPFSGRRPSNSIHVDVLASVIFQLLTTATVPSGIVNVADAPQTSMADVLRFHAAISGNREPSPMDDLESEQILGEQLAALKRTTMRGAIRQLVATGVGAALVASSDNQDSRHIASVLSRYTTAATLNRVKRLASRRQIERAVAPSKPAVINNSLLLSAPMPGPYLSDRMAMPSSAVARQESADEMRRWYLDWARPDWPSERARRVP